MAWFADPRVAEVLTQSLLGATRPGTAGGAAFTNGLLLPANSSDLVSFTTSTTITNINTGVAAVIYTFVFQVRMPSPLDAIAARVRCRHRWQVTDMGPGGSTGRVNLDARKSGVAITGLTKFNGPTRALDGLATFTEDNLVIDLPATSFAAGDSLDIRIEFEVVGTAAVAILDVQHHHDPAVAANNLLVEIDL